MFKVFYTLFLLLLVQLISAGPNPSGPERPVDNNPEFGRGRGGENERRRDRWTWCRCIVDPRWRDL